MKILHGGGFSEEETKNFKVDLMNNVVDNITKLIEMMQTLNIEFKVDILNSNNKDKVSFQRGTIQTVQKQKVPLKSPRLD